MLKLIDVKMTVVTVIVMVTALQILDHFGMDSKSPFFIAALAFVTIGVYGGATQLVRHISKKRGDT